MGRNENPLTALLALSAVVSGVGAGACARSTDRSAAAPLPHVALGTEGTPPGAPAIPFRRKTAEQRMEFMGLTFHPRMSALFRSHGYAEFRCQTCHGEDMEARAYRMPATLRPLGDDPVSAGRARDEKATSFMVSEVTPLTVELLGEGDPEARTALGCFTCHAKE